MKRVDKIVISLMVVGIVLAVLFSGVLNPEGRSFLRRPDKPIDVNVVNRPEVEIASDKSDKRGPRDDERVTRPSLNNLPNARQILLNRLSGTNANFQKRFARPTDGAQFLMVRT